MSVQSTFEWEQFLEFSQDADAGGSRYSDFQDLLDDALFYTPGTPHALPTPGASATDSSPASASASGTPGGGRTVITVSTTFAPGATTDAARAPDTILLSADRVHFYVHAHRLLAASTNQFGAFLPPAPAFAFASPAPTPGGALPLALVLVPEPSPALNALLHALYGRSCLPFLPSLADLSAAAAALPRYGLAPSTHLAPDTPLYTALAACLPADALAVYALAAAHDARALAAEASTHLLALHLPALGDADAARIGAVYLKRLFFLHLGRVEALKRLLLAPPATHAPAPACKAVQQKALARAWALAAACLVWDARPDTTTEDITGALGSLEQHTECARCRAALQVRIRAVVDEWASVKTTICI